MLLVVACVACSVAGAPPAFPQGGPPRSRVSVGTVEERIFSLRLEVLGEVEPVRESRPSAEVEGLVQEVLVDEGTRVEAGQPLVRLSTEQRRIQRRRAEAELRQVEEQLREYRAGSRPEEIRQAEAAVKSAKAILDETEESLRRVESLHEKGTVSDQELTTARARALSARGIHEERVAAHDLVRAGPRAEVVARAEATVAMKRAELHLIEDEILRAEVPAPFAGVVTEKLVEKGDYVRLGDPVAAMVELDPIRATLEMPESAVDRVREGTEIRVIVDALSAGAPSGEDGPSGNRPERDLRGGDLAGTLEAVVPRGDRLARTFPIKVRLANPDGRLLPGMTARGILTLPSPAPSLAVPADAIVRTDAGVVHVYAVRDGRAAFVPVSAGLTEGGLVEVRGPLAAGEKVIVRGNERVLPDMPVEVLEAMEPRGAPEGEPPRTSTARGATR